MEISLKGVVARYLNIWEPRAPKNGKGDPKYGGTFLVDPKNKEMVKLIRDTIKAVAKEKWKDKATGILARLEGDKQKHSWFEEDMLTEEGDEVPGTEGMYYIRDNNATQPGIFDRDRTELRRKDGKPYAGCVVLVKIDIWAQDNTHGKGIRVELRGVQFMRDGEPFGGGTKAKADEFEDLSDLGDDDEAPKKRRPADEDDEPAPKAKKKRPPVVEDEDDIG